MSLVAAYRNPIDEQVCCLFWARTLFRIAIKLHIYIPILIRFVLQFALGSYAPCMCSLSYGHKHHVLPMSPQVKCRVATVLRTLGVPRKSVSLLRSLTNMLRCEVGRFLRGPY